MRRHRCRRMIGTGAGAPAGSGFAPGNDPTVPVLAGLRRRNAGGTTVAEARERMRVHDLQREETHMFGTEIGSRKVFVIGRKRIATVVLAVVAVVSGIASAAEDVDGGAAVAARKIVMRDGDFSPSVLTMSRNEVLEFENNSGQYMRFIFLEPRDQIDKIRCYPIDHTTTRPNQMSWLFDWDPGRRLSATIPPGRFASACSFVPGQYAFVATRVSHDPRATDYALGARGTITVE